MRQFFQQLVNGTVLGATYGLIALGYTMVYGIIQLINFAHGEVFMAGAFAGLSAHRWLLPDALTGNAFVALPVMVLVAVVVAVLTAVLMERLAYRPLRNVPPGPPDHGHRGFDLPPGADPDLRPATGPSRSRR